ncbi:GGDEF domain-containing protein [Oleisolibacter albus]|uniref:GGDEF domain-containing protein n=1 Tax=Oleisolibacter albus TaxID=2171757 RepID=UPI000DF20DD2|nr:GGDEF domain-containing protein [Oleisolibacter albus]
MGPLDVAIAPLLTGSPGIPLDAPLARTRPSLSEGSRLRLAIRQLREAEALIARQQARITELEKLSTTDVLTGLLNRRGFAEAFQRVLADARRSQRGGALIFVDLDGFKAINDRNGHACGDAYLQRAATVLRDHVRGHDLVARLGGDEFAVVLTGSTPAAARSRATHLAALFHGRTCCWQGEALPLRASFGLQPFAPGDAVDAVLAAADAAMYRMKQARRAIA